MKDYKIDLGLDIEQSDLNEIREKMDALSKWLVNNMTSFTASAICLQGIINIIDNLQEELDASGN